jgi:uncharacterized membrane protein YgcG
MREGQSGNRAIWQKVAALALFAALLALVITANDVHADEGWVIRSFDVTYQINDNGTIDVMEDIRVDFFNLPEKHGIIHDIRVEQKYDDRHNRLYGISIAGVDDGERGWKYETSRASANLRIKVGDPDKTVKGPQRYRIRYRLSGALNPQDEWDEFFWNVTGDQSPVAIEQATAVVAAPAIHDIRCFQGSQSSEPCNSRKIGNSQAQFATTRRLSPGSELTIAVAMPKGAVALPPPRLVRVKTPWEQVKDFIGLKPLPMGAAVLVGFAGVGMVMRYWWLNGRDRWFGDVHYLTGATEERRKPIGAKDTVVVEYTPPELSGRPLRPAEIGTLLDEKADTLDVSATIVDLAVRGYLRITELPKEGLFGKKDYRIERLKPADHELLGYEVTLYNALFEEGESVEMSDLKNEFYTDLAKVKEALYAQAVRADEFFASSPETVRTVHYVVAAVVMALGAGAIVLLGNLGIGAIIGVPIVLAALLMLAFAGAMPRRTGKGREYYRRALGFREYMTIAETDRQKFYEEENIFEKYLPYAIVYDCVDKWAKAFEGLEGQPATRSSGWYVGTGPFIASSFSNDINSFSSSISTAIASTPGGSGGSGFSSGGGFSGGGGGGGGTGSW